MTLIANHLEDVLSMLVPSAQFGSESMRDTPTRMLRALEDMTSGYEQDPREILRTDFESEGYDQVIVVRGIPFASLCEHHVLPFTGTADVAYLPGDRIVGLSKIPRLVECFARRLQVQERLTRDIAGALQEHLDPRGVMVVLRGTHSCMALRGVRSTGEMVTSDVRGLFRTDDAARAEALMLLR
jgi:GTP cyclohydrolase I